MFNFRPPAKGGVATILCFHNDKTSHWFMLGVLLIAAFGSYSVAAEVNLIQDGGFETDQIEPGDSKLGLGNYGAWVSPTPGGCFGSTELLGLPFPHLFGKLPLSAYEGTAGMNIGPCFGGGSVSQSFPTVVGENYKISLAVIGGTVTATVFNARHTDVSVDFAASEGEVWSAHSQTFTATDSVSTINVQNTSPTTGSCCAPTIDDVRVTLNNPGI